MKCIRCENKIKQDGSEILFSKTPHPYALKDTFLHYFSRNQSICFFCASGIIGMNFGILPGFISQIIYSQHDLFFAILLLAGDINPFQPNALSQNIDVKRKEPIAYDKKVIRGFDIGRSRMQPEWILRAFTLQEALEAIKERYPLEDVPPLTVLNLTRKELDHWWNGRSPRIIREHYGYNTPPITSVERLLPSEWIPEGWGMGVEQIRRRPIPLPIEINQSDIVFPTTPLQSGSPSFTKSIAGKLICTLCGMPIERPSSGCENIHPKL